MALHRSCQLISVSTLACINPVKIQIRGLSAYNLNTTSSIPVKKQKLIPTSGTYPKGFTVGSIYAGCKPVSASQHDLILVASEKPSCGAAVFTQHEFPAPSITVSKAIVQESRGQGIQGIIANSGCANLFTGKAGLEDTATMSRETKKHLSTTPSTEQDPSVLVMHTGAGGQRLPISKIVQSIPKLQRSMGSSHQHWLAGASAMRTTDSFPKLCSRTFTLPSYSKTTFSIVGITKGAGMIHPNMATTLGIICTDAPVTPAALQQLLSTAADKSYNCISIEGDTSTNDMVAMLANGAAVAAVDQNEVDFDPSLPSQSPDFVALQHILISFMAEMAKLVVRDGEGATKFITIRVRNSPSYPAAKHIASVIARSILVKVCMYAKDLDWGGIVVALGYSLINTPFAGKGIIVPQMTSVSFVSLDNQLFKVFEKGVPVQEIDGTKAKEIMEREDIEVIVDLRDGEQQTKDVEEEAVYWTCDLTHEFVTVNGDFRT